MSYDTENPARRHPRHRDRAAIDILASVQRHNLIFLMKKLLQESDINLFQEEMEDVLPIEHKYAEQYRERPRPFPRPKENDWDDEEQAGLAEEAVETHDYLSFTRPGVQKRVFHDLTRGDINIDLEVDLHGLSVDYAHRTLREFLVACRERRVRCARIIHGKGFGSSTRQPALKQKVNYWLRLREDVLAFCSATRRDGGTGAVYVLLRNPNKSKRRGHGGGQR